MLGYTHKRDVFKDSGELFNYIFTTCHSLIKFKEATVISGCMRFLTCAEFTECACGTGPVV